MGSASPAPGGGRNYDTRHLYRCKFPAQYAIRKGLDHPRSVSVGELAITERLDTWLLRAFDPENLKDTVAALVAVQDGPTDDARLDAAKRAIADCDRRLARFKQALEADADPAVVAVWISGSTRRAS